MDIAITEQALIGGIITRPAWIQQVADNLKPEDFHCNTSRKAYLAALGLWRASKPVDLVSIANAVDNVIYCSEAITNSITAKPRYYAGLIAEAAKRRRVVADLNRIGGIKSPDDQLSEMYLTYQRELSTGDKSADIGDVLKRFDAVVATNKQRKTLGWRTGFTALETAYIQYVAGHIWTIGGYTSTGKTAVVIQKVCNLINLEHTPKIIFISTEMSEEQVVARLISNFTSIPTYRILSGNYQHGEEEMSEACRTLIACKPLQIYDSVYEANDIERVFHRGRLRGGVEVGVIDYVQNCRIRGMSPGYETQADLAKRLQKLAKECRCTLLCLSQVSNAVGRGETSQLELKGAGEWAAVSDLGVMLYRHSTNKNQLKYEVKKNRHGRLLDFMMEYKMDFTSVEETIER